MECKYESSVREIPHAQETVYQSLSDLRNLERIKERMPEEKVQGMEFDQDTMAVSMPPVGRIALRIIEREEPKCIKFETEQSPLDFNFWIQLLPVTEQSCKMRLTLKADLNPLIRGMVGGKLQEAIDKIAEMLAAIPYE
ncbi:MAG: SRPBCC family protein [Prevotella sp.]|jgi:carbon monoxide dehydrogenase subunit G|uniref:SRPBCC family protein n=1 Tax=Prevotella sp. Rep29 TaxID=2691580 RepID=UPI001C6E1645|nr:SRPBCC family protein [Prevotella sp. Rep29]MBQ3623822.1 SRPBCC family protein [Prevotella sp.]MBR1655001.1 SRPBCC family protein [Prevotella sp.]MBR3444561.1 SRPBCC family protein [Prevotella sp.]MBR7093301.1 SRPBCC family protein [Prevotella sp.]QYR09632.1 SRPBCC family protein [Prevotella sp. Rep29]